MEIQCSNRQLHCVHNAHMFSHYVLVYMHHAFEAYIVSLTFPVLLGGTQDPSNISEWQSLPQCKGKMWIIPIRRELISISSYWPWRVMQISLCLSTYCWRVSFGKYSRHNKYLQFWKAMWSPISNHSDKRPAICSQGSDICMYGSFFYVVFSDTTLLLPCFFTMSGEVFLVSKGLLLMIL